MNDKKRILFLEFHQESNTFNPITASAELFLPSLIEGKAAYDPDNGVNLLRTMAAHAAQAVEDAGGEVIPAAFIRSNSSGGRVADEVLQLLMEKLTYYVNNSGPVDGVYAALHGATCTVSEDDACGALLAHVRALVGKDVPIAASFDLHANITPRLLESADIVCGYRTYPHVDQAQTGRRAASLLMRKLAGEPVEMAAVRVSMMIPPAGYTTLEEPFKSLMDRGDALIADGTLLDCSVFAVQPWLDIDCLGSTVIAIAGDAETAKAYAEEQAETLWSIREDCWPELVSIDEVIDHAEAAVSAGEGGAVGKPVLLIDAADSTNGGAVGDSPAVALRLLERGSTLLACMFIKDPAAVLHAFAVGVGNAAEFTVGAGYTPGLPGPLKAVGTVRSLHDGKCRRGAPKDVGLAAVIAFGNLDILVCDEPCASGDPELLRHFGIEPKVYDLVVVKANTSFRATYGQFAGAVYFADTPGAGASNLRLFDWKHIPEGIYPFN